MLAFGERCLYKFNKVAHQKEKDGKMSAKWGEGVFLGYSRDSNEFIIWSTTTKTVTRARSVQRRPGSVRWSAEELMTLNQRPGDSLYRATVPLETRYEAGQDFEQRLNPEDEPPRTRTTSTRDMKVTLGDLKKFGFTEIGCPRCDYIKLNGNSAHCGHSHSKICRDRIKQKLSETEEGRSRLEALDERLRRARPSPEEGSERMEARAVEELVREGLPEHVQLRGD